MCADLVDEIILCDGEPIEDAHLIWTKLCEKFGQSKCDESHGNEKSNTITTALHCCEEKGELVRQHDLSAAGLANPVRPVCNAGQAGITVRPGLHTGQTDMPSYAAAQVHNLDLRRAEESTCTAASTSDSSLHTCLMAKKNTKKKPKKVSMEKKKVKDQDEYEDEVEIEDSYTLDHLSKKGKLILMRLLEKNDELELENEKQEQSLERQEEYLVSKLKELKAMTERYEKLSFEHALVTNSSSSVAQLEKDNIELKAKLDELSSKYNVLQANYVHLKCSHEELVESHIMLEMAHEVVITSVKSSQPHTHTHTYTPSKLNTLCTNKCVSQASQSLIEHTILENNELKEEVEKLKEGVIRLKGKEKAQPSQDNRDNMVKKLEKGSNLASFNTQQKNHTSSNDKATKSKKHGKRMCYGYGMYGHEGAMCPHKSWADKYEVAEQKASTKLTKQVKSEGPSACPKCKGLGHSIKNCFLNIKNKETRKNAQVATRRCYGCNEKGHMIGGCPNKQNMHMANNGRICYTCRRKGHLSKDCPKGNLHKPNTLVYTNMLRKTTNGVSTTKMVCSPQTSTRVIWVPKYLLSNMNGPNKCWVPKQA
jgi:hypothetical protein